jgi:hypothetical protein
MLPFLYKRGFASLINKNKKSLQNFFEGVYLV